jgi:hypothetical protein
MQPKKSWSQRGISLVFLLVLFVSGSAHPQPTRASSAFVVNTQLDFVGDDGYLSLREAILVANGGGAYSCGWSTEEMSQMIGCTWDPETNCISGGCGPGIADTIIFNTQIHQINLYAGLPALTDNGTWIDGSLGGGDKVVIGVLPATLLYGPMIEIDSAHVSISNLVFINGDPNWADILVWWTAQDARIFDNSLGVKPGATSCAQAGVTRNSGSGIWVRGSVTNPIADDRAFIYGNVIGCHPNSGILADGADHMYIGYQPDKATAAGNWIGRSAAGSSLPNSGYGIRIVGAGADNLQANWIGNNTIANNGLAGVAVEALAGATVIGTFIRYNTLYSNGGLPIDLGSDGHTPNDAGDADSGPNNYLNYPQVTYSSGSAIWGTAEPYCSVDIYQAVGNPSQHGGGGFYKGNVTVNQYGNWYVDLSTLPGMTGKTSADVSFTTYCPYSGSSEMSPRPVLYLPAIKK